MGAGHAQAVGLPHTNFIAIETDPTDDIPGDFSFVSTVPGSMFQCNLEAAGFNDGTGPIETEPHSGPILATRSR